MQVSWQRIITAALAFALTATASCQTKKDLQIWGIAINENSQGHQAVLREFERRHPEYRVRAISLGAGGMDPQKLMTGIVGDVPPDVIFQDRFTISDWASRGAFMSLNGLLASDPTAPKSSAYYPATWKECCFGGHVYGIPSEADNRALFWNRGLFRANAATLKAAGLDPNRAPRTWSELLAYSKALTVYNADGTLRIAGFIPTYGDSWLYLYAFENDARFISEDGKRCTADSPEAVQALQLIVDGYKVEGGYENCVGFESGFLYDENDPFVRGKVAMKIDGSWQLNTLSASAPNLDFGVAPPPVPDDRFYHRGRFAKDKNTYVTWTGGHAYSIPRGARNPVGAWEFIKFSTSVEGRMIEAQGQAEWAAYRHRDFVFALQSNSKANEAIYAKYRPSDPRLAEGLRTSIDLMSSSQTRPVTFVGQLMWNECQRALDSACRGTSSPQAALTHARRTVQADIDAFYTHTSRSKANLGAVAKFLYGAGVLLALLLLVAYRRLKLKRLERHEARWGFALVSPWVVGFILFILGPMIGSLILSFTEYNELTDARWAGFANYAAMATSDQLNVSKAFGNALYLASVGVPLGIFTGLAIALLLSANSRGIKWYRTLFYMPAIVPTIPSAILWSWVLAADPSRGLVNSIWSRTIEVWLHWPPPGWLSSEAWAKPALIVMGLWGAGSGMILWLAGLKGVPKTLYEASEIDGASPRQQFLSITLPQLSPIIFFNLVVGFIGALQEFDRVYMFRGNGETTGPGDSLLTPSYYLFQNAFAYFKMGYASALAWALFLIILLLTLIQFRLAPKWVHYEADK
jgi:multiple sugar transport system permease protein